MKFTKLLLTAALVGGLAFANLAVRAAGKHDDHRPKVKAYVRTKCLVSDNKLDEHGKPYVFVHKGQEIKLCCRDCLKDFKRDSAKYLKKLEDPKKSKQ